MRRLLALLLFAAMNAWAGDCSLVSVGISENGTGSSAISFSPMPTAQPGDLMVLHGSTYTASQASVADPTGYTLLASSHASHEVWVKIAGRSETDPGIDFDAKQVAYLAVLRNTTGFPNVASLLGDEDDGGGGASTNINLLGLTVTQGGDCFIQFGSKQTTTNNTNTPTAVATTSGFTQIGFATLAQTNSPTIAGQLYSSTASGAMTGNAVNITGNDDSAADRLISLTLLSGDDIPAGAFTDLTGQAVSTTVFSAAIVPTSYDNWSKVDVTGDTGCAASIAGGAYSASTQYINAGESIALSVTTGGAGTTKNCSPVYGNTAVTGDTFSASTNASDTTAPTYSVSPTLVSESATTVTVSATAADGVDSSVTHIIGVVANGASAPTGAQLDACSGGGIITSSCSEGSQTNGVSKSLTTPSVLTANTAYDVYHTVVDGSLNYATPVKVDVTTDASDQTATILLADLFSGTDGTDLIGHTPNTIASGEPYEAVSGQIYINTNKAVAAAGGSYVIDVGNTDHVADMQWTAGSGGLAYQYLRYQDSTHYTYCSAAPATIKIWTRNDTVVTQLATATFTPVAGTTYRYTAIVTPDDVLSCAIDGTVLVTATNTDYAASTTVGFGAATTAQTFDSYYVHLAYDALNSSGYVPDDPQGILGGLSIGAGSAYWVKPANDPATICSDYAFYAGGSVYCAPQSGTTSINMELFNTTTNALSTIALQIVNPGSGTVAPNISDITNETVSVNVDPGPRDLTQYLTAGQPAPTWDLTAGYNTTTGEVCPGRILAPTGVVSGICTVPGTYSNTARATNATGNDTDSFDVIVGGDTVPDGSFNFTDITDATASSTQTTDPCWTVAGINTTTTVTFSSSTGVQFNKNAGSYGTSSTTVVLNDVLCMQGTASSTPSASIAGTLTVGGVARSWTVITSPADLTPDQITFVSQANVAPSSTVTSNCQTISGLSDGVTLNVTLTSGEWTKNCSAASPTYVSSLTGSVHDSDSIGLRHTASATNGAQTTQTFAYGNRTAEFTSVVASGTLPACSAIPAVTATVGDAFSLDLTAYTDDVDSFTVGTLPSTIVANGAILSGIFTSDTDGATLTTTIGGSNAYGSCSTELDFLVNPADNSQWTPITRPTNPWSRIPRVNE